MRRIGLMLAGLMASGVALADKYGVDEALGEGTGDLSDMVWGAALIGLGYLAWKKLFK